MSDKARALLTRLTWMWFGFLLGYLNEAAWRIFAVVVVAVRLLAVSRAGKKQI